MVEEILDNLVSQFTDPFTFYRELIQNAMDAGSGTVEVTVRWRAEDGRAIVEVADSGEGMNKRIITQELTRLFSSSKEGDLTKIGKFGIGFVSVFAIRPDRVVVDTGRDGEYWRVIFDGTTRFECLRLETPVEGTRVRIYKALPESEFAEFVNRSRETIRFWCRYSDTPVTFCGTPINETLDVALSPLKVRHEQPGTEVVAGLVGEVPPPFGMYNRGLTLKEGAEAFFPGVAFRIKSRYMEHTLTRDNVLQDANFEKAMGIVRDVVRRQLPVALFRRVAELLEGLPRTHGELDMLLGEAAPFLGSWRQWMPRKWRKLPLFPAVHGEALSLRELRRQAWREGVLYLEPLPNRVTEELDRTGVQVLSGTLQGGIARAAEAVTGRPLRLASLAVATPVVAEEIPPQMAGLAAALLGMLNVGHTRYGGVLLATFDYAGSCIASRVCVAQPVPGQPIRLFRRPLWQDLRLDPATLLLNGRHPLVRQCLARIGRAPLLAAYTLAKAGLLDDGLSASMEAALLGRALRYRAEPLSPTVSGYVRYTLEQAKLLF